MKRSTKLKWISVGAATLALSALIGGCATSPPQHPEDICSIFHEHRSWYRDADRAGRRWDVPTPLVMAFMFQESSYRHDAKPPRRKLLGFIPWFRPSSAHGYAQATDAAWSDYVRDTGRWRAERTDFGDAADFVAWYVARSRSRLGIPSSQAKDHYLAYHEGHSGFARGSYRGNAQLVGIAERVGSRAALYSRQLATCEEDLDDPWWWPF